MKRGESNAIARSPEGGVGEPGGAEPIVADQRPGRPRPSPAAKPKPAGTIWRPSSGWDAPGMLTWQLALYLLVLGFVSVLLAPLTNLWWIIPLLGVAAPVALAISGALLGGAGQYGSDAKARELLDALADRGELTAAEAALATSCTAAEASTLLQGLTRQGQLARSTRDGEAIFTLPVERIAATPALPATRKASGADGQAGQLAEPLSEREREVLALLASGKTTSEAARDLFVSVGTIKSHSGNIYRKLGAKNRTQAISRARDLGLLP